MNIAQMIYLFHCRSTFWLFSGESYDIHIMLNLGMYFGVKLVGQSHAIYFLKVAYENFHCSTFLLTLILSVFLAGAIVFSSDFNLHFPDD